MFMQKDKSRFRRNRDGLLFQLAVMRIEDGLAADAPVRVGG
jgi:hypothetical protein